LNHEGNLGVAEVVPPTGTAAQTPPNLLPSIKNPSGILRIELEGRRRQRRKMPPFSAILKDRVGVEMTPYMILWRFFSGFFGWDRFRSIG